jgi:hypothetical protein
MPDMLAYTQRLQGGGLRQLLSESPLLDHAQPYLHSQPLNNTPLSQTGMTLGGMLLHHSDLPWRGSSHTHVIRDELVNSAQGTTSFNGVTYTTTVEDITGLLLPGSDGINHGVSLL